MSDKIELQPRYIEGGKSTLEGQLLINDILLLDPDLERYSIDILELIKSIESDGEYFIITCVCGDHGCAGIEKGIAIKRVENTIIWNIDYPFQGIEIFGKLVFDFEVYKRNIETGTNKFVNLMLDHDNAKIVPIGMGENKKEIVERVNKWKISE
jgi:hypothetical protein